MTSKSYLKKIEEKKILSGVEKLGLLSKLEKAGLTLSKVCKIHNISSHMTLYGQFSPENCKRSINICGECAAANAVWQVQQFSPSLDTMYMLKLARLWVCKSICKVSRSWMGVSDQRTERHCKLLVAVFGCQMQQRCKHALIFSFLAAG